MFRKVTLGALLIVAFSFFALGFGLGQQMPLALNIGSPAVTLVQQGAVVYSSGTDAAPTLPVPSTAGTCLIVVLESDSGGTPTNLGPPAGWTQLVSVTQGANSRLEIWAYIFNPGGITGVTVAQVIPGWYLYRATISEWANVKILSVLETSGTATATSGTTLAPTTAGNILTAGDLALSAWGQKISPAGAVTFTTPAGFTRLIDDGSNAANTGHLDVEYKVNPATGATLGPTLTSTGTTTTAVGAIVALKSAPPVADWSPYLVYGSLSLKLNTLDFTLVDCPTIQQPMSNVTLSDPGNYPDWTGTVSQVQARDVVDIRSGHHFQVITATNTQLPNFTGAPFNLSDNPAANTTDMWLLENGDTWALENGTGSWLMESSVQENSYNGLSIGSQVGATSPAVTLTTLGNLTVPASREQPNAVNLWPGMTFKLTSSNLANWITAPGGLYTIQTITITYQGANPPLPVFDVQFGIAVDTATAIAIASGAAANTWTQLFGRTLTLAEWTKAHAT